MRWMVLTPKQAAKYKQYKITPWWGIDPIQTKDGRWVLRADQINEIEGFKTIIRQQNLKPQQIDAGIIKANISINELKTIKNIAELTKDDFPEEEINTGPQDINYAKIQ